MSFFSFLSPDVQGELLKTEFAKYGKVTAFKFFEKDHKMALIQMETIDDAVMGLIVSICCDRHTLVIYCMVMAGSHSYIGRGVMASKEFLV